MPLCPKVSISGSAQHQKVSRPTWESQVQILSQSGPPKGHLISEQICEDIDFTESQWKYCKDVFPSLEKLSGQIS